MTRNVLTLAIAVILFPLCGAAAEAPQIGDVAVQNLSDQHSIRFTLITSHGYVGFTVPGNWSLIAMQSHLPITVTAFQIPDAADEGTKDSTNLAVRLFQPDSDKAQAALKVSENQYIAENWTSETYKAWTIHKHDAAQGPTTYTIVDAYTPVADVDCGVRLAWPHLAMHSGEYGSSMKAVLMSLLDSMEGQSAPYQIHSGELVRRPAN
jgi:hypothetical protein